MAQPEVTAIPRPEADLKEVLRLDAGGFFVLLQVGAEAKWSFYDWPERQLTNVCHTRVAGTMKFRGEECLNVIDRVIWGEDDCLWRRWLYRIDGETWTFRLRETHRKTGEGEIAEVDMTPQPLRLRIGDTWEGHEVYRCGDAAEGVGDVERACVDGAFEVAVPARDDLCLRETWWDCRADGSARSLAEIYVAQSGRTIYFRRFNGPGWGNYGQLAGNPEREHDGVAWRLWYECLPDIALVASAEEAGR
jgi:hypothetical protein